MYQHFRILGWILLVLGIIGALGILAGGAMEAAIFLGMGAVMGQASSAVGNSPHPGHTPQQDAAVMKAMQSMTSPMLVGIVVVVLIGVAIAALQIIAGAGLLRRRPWAFNATKISSIISLPGVPFWTALGVYGLWLTFSADGIQTWQEYLGGADTPQTSVK
jgi:hypothetical protein